MTPETSLPAHDLAAIQRQVEARNRQEEAEFGTGPEFPDLQRWRSDIAFAGPAPARQYLVGGVFPMGQPSLLAAEGGLGKSFAILALARDVAFGPAWAALGRLASENAPRHFGGKVEHFGVAVVLSAEDDDIEIHGRIEALGGPHEKLIVVPLPSTQAGGAPFFEPDPATKRPTTTAAYQSLVVQLRGIEDLAVVFIDPLQAVCTLDLNAPENAQAVCSHLARLASETRAAIIATHHFRKTEVADRREARQAVRGSAGLVDGVRAVYAMWLADDKKTGGASTKKLCDAAGVVWEPGRVVHGAVVKANGKGSSKTTTFVRGDNGVLIDQTDAALGLGGGDELLDLLVEGVEAAAKRGQPLTRTGASNGLYARRHELAEPLQLVAKHRLPELADELLAAGRLGTYMAGGKAVKWLDVPDGPFARGEGVFVEGAGAE